MLRVFQIEDFREDNPSLYEAFKRVIQGVNNLGTKLGVEPTTAPQDSPGLSLPAPLAPSTLNMSASNGVFSAQIIANPANQGTVLFYLEYDDSSLFPNATVVALGNNTQTSINLGAAVVKFWRARCKYAESDYSDYVYFGHPPTGINGAGALTGANDIPFNSDFESFGVGATVADGWTGNYETSGAPTLAANYARSSSPFQGTFAQAIIGGNVGASIVSRQFGVKERIKYKFQCRAKINAGAGAADGFFMRVFWFSNDDDLSALSASKISTNDIVAGGAANFGANNTYTQFNGSVAAPVNARFCRLAFYSWTNPGAARTITVDTSSVHIAEISTAQQASPVTSGPTTTSLVFTVIPEMTQTIVCTGRPVVLLFTGAFQFNSNADFITAQFFKDGVQIGPGVQVTPASANNPFTVNISFIDNPTAGSHTYDVRWLTFAGHTLTALFTIRSLQVMELG